jgi:hypothetical protein
MCSHVAEASPNAAYDLWFDATTVDSDLLVTCWISHGPRAGDPWFDPQPRDMVLVGDDEEERQPARVVSRDGDYVMVQLATAGTSAGAGA